MSVARGRYCSAGSQFPFLHPACLPLPSYRRHCTRIMFTIFISNFTEFNLMRAHRIVSHRIHKRRTLLSDIERSHNRLPTLESCTFLAVLMRFITFFMANYTIKRRSKLFSLIIWARRVEKSNNFFTFGLFI